MEFTTGCDGNGYLTAMKAVVVADLPAYASLGGPVLQRLSPTPPAPITIGLSTSTAPPSTLTTRPPAVPRLRRDPELLCRRV